MLCDENVMLFCHFVGNVFDVSLRKKMFLQYLEAAATDEIDNLIASVSQLAEETKTTARNFTGFLSFRVLFLTRFTAMFILSALRTCMRRGGSITRWLWLSKPIFYSTRFLCLAQYAPRVTSLP